MSRPTEATGGSPGPVQASEPNPIQPQVEPKHPNEPPSRPLLTTRETSASSRVFAIAELRKVILDELSERDLFVGLMVSSDFNSTICNNPHMMTRASLRDYRARGPLPEALSPFLYGCKDGLFDFVPFRYANMRCTDGIPTLQFDYNTLDGHVSNIGFRGKRTTHYHSQSWGELRAGRRTVHFQVQILVVVGQGWCGVTGDRPTSIPVYKEHVVFSTDKIWTLREIFEVFYEVMERSLEEHLKLSPKMFLAHRNKGTPPVELTS